MNRLLFLLFVTALFACKNKGSSAQHIEKFTLLSSTIGDSFTIQIRKPVTFKAADSFNIVYAVDGSIGIGDYLLGKDTNWSASLPGNCIIITIGHLGDWHMKRRRDFIPSDISKDTTIEFGQANKFYFFLKDELMPLIDKRNFHEKSKLFIGHSFGGLFCLYAALKNDGLFDNYFAISPSVWANYYEMLKIEKAFSEKSKELKANVSIYAGSLEIFNKVLSSSKQLYDSIQSRNYKSLQVNFEVISNANHFSIRKPAIDKILRSLNREGEIN